MKNPVHKKDKKKKYTRKRGVMIRGGQWYEVVMYADSRYRDALDTSDTFTETGLRIARTKK